MTGVVVVVVVYTLAYMPYINVHIHQARLTTCRTMDAKSYDFFFASCFCDSFFYSPAAKYRLGLRTVAGTATGARLFSQSGFDLNLLGTKLLILVFPLSIRKRKENEYN